jgi:hypothetical protein
MPQPKDDLSRSLVALDQHTTLIAVVELSLSTWLVGGMIPGIARDPLKKLVPNKEGLLKLLDRWCDEAIKTGHKIARMAVALKLVQMGSGWRAGCAIEGSKRTSFIRRASRYLSSSAERRPIG